MHPGACMELSGVSAEGKRVSWEAGHKQGDTSLMKKQVLTKERGMVRLQDSSLSLLGILLLKALKADSLDE